MTIRRPVAGRLRPRVCTAVLGALVVIALTSTVTGQVSAAETPKPTGTEVAAGGPRSAAAELPSFTCCNFRYEGDWISDANWTKLPFIPAGTPVTVTRLRTQSAELLIDGRKFRIGLDYGRERETFQQFMARVIVKEDPRVRLAGYPANVQAAIAEGKVIAGMTPEQVVMAMGEPRKDLTPSLDGSVWTYATIDENQFTVHWSAERKVAELRSLVEESQRAEGELFTCCNLRQESGWISDANWADLPMIPAGTRVGVKTMGNLAANVVVNGRKMQFGLDYAREVETMGQWLARVLLREDPRGRLAGYAPEVRAAIAEGKVMIGMTPEQVVTALGEPRKDETPSLDAATWTYYTVKEEPYTVHWTDDRKVADVRGKSVVKMRVMFTP